MRHLLSASFIAVVPMLVLPVAAQDTQTIAPDTELRVKMTSALSSRSNRPGDGISGTVISPEMYKGATVEGEVKEAKSSGKLNKTSTLNFAFKSLQWEGKTMPIQAQVKSFVNSQGKENVDEEGRIVEKQNNVGKLALIAGAATVAGALAGGGKGAAIGAAAGAAIGLLFIKVGVKGPDIRFDPGSEFTLLIRERGDTAATR